MLTTSKQDVTDQSADIKLLTIVCAVKATISTTQTAVSAHLLNGRPAQERIMSHQWSGVPSTARDDHRQLVDVVGEVRDGVLPVVAHHLHGRGQVLGEGHLVGHRRVRLPNASGLRTLK